MSMIKRNARNKFEKFPASDDVSSQLSAEINSIKTIISGGIMNSLMDEINAVKVELEDESFLALKRENNIQQLGSISGTVHLDLTLGNIFVATVIDNTSFIITDGIIPNKINTITLYLNNPGYGTLIFPTNTVFDGSINPVLPVSGATLIVLNTFDNGFSWTANKVWEKSN